MLDDIGAEVMTSWTRDEILGSIMQFRMQENLPTFFHPILIMGNYNIILLILKEEKKKNKSCPNHGKN